MKNQAFFEELADIVESKSMLTHPYYVCWQKGRLTKEELQDYVKEYYHLERAFPQFMSSIHSRCDDADTRQTILKNLNGEELGDDNHVGQLWGFCAAFDVTKEEALATQANPETDEMVATFSELTQDRTIENGMAAFVAYKQQIGEVAKTKVEGLQEWYGVTSESGLQFFRTHAQEDKSWHEMLDARVRDDNKASIRESVTKACDALLTFLDGMTTASIRERAAA